MAPSGGGRRRASARPSSLQNRAGNEWPDTRAASRLLRGWRCVRARPTRLAVPCATSLRKGDREAGRSPGAARAHAGCGALARCPDAESETARHGTGKMTPRRVNTHATWEPSYGAVGPAKLALESGLCLRPSADPSRICAHALADDRQEPGGRGRRPQPRPQPAARTVWPHPCGSKAPLFLHPRQTVRPR